MQVQFAHNVKLILYSSTLKIISFFLNVSQRIYSVFLLSIHSALIVQIPYILKTHLTQMGVLTSLTVVPPHPAQEKVAYSVNLTQVITLTPLDCCVHRSEIVSKALMVELKYAQNVIPSCSLLLLDSVPRSKLKVA